MIKDSFSGRAAFLYSVDAFIAGVVIYSFCLTYDFRKDIGFGRSAHRY